MLCCIVGFTLILRFVYGMDVVRNVLGMKPKKKREYDISYYCELDDYAD